MFTSFFEYGFCIFTKNKKIKAKKFHSCVKNTHICNLMCNLDTFRKRLQLKATMKKFSYLLIFLLFAINAKSQLLSWAPSFITDTSTNVTITCDASQGNQGLLNYTPVSDVYVHIGLITSKSTSSKNWLYVPTFSAWGVANPQIQCVSLGNNKWKYTFSGSLRAFFGVTDPTEQILKIAIIFRNGAGTKQMGNIDGSDMFVPVYAEGGFFTRLDAPVRQPLYSPALVPITKVVGDNVTVTANTNQNASISLLFNGVQIGSATNAQSASATATIASGGTQTIIAVSNNGTATSSDTSTFFVASATTVLPVPAGNVDGINYEKGDTSVTLVLYAPFKTKSILLGDFNNWTPTSSYQMNRTPDSLRYWIRLTGLTSGTEYAYQFLIDDTIQVADNYAEKVLDKNVDPQIPASSYPNLKAFPAKAAGSLASVLQTGQVPYTWQVPNFTRPDKRNLLVYELLVRDFISAQNWITLTDTLTYLKRLGVNAIEVLPFCNFEGFSSWGYNPNFFLAPDKVYGTPTALKQFIDACHQQGIAVIMDLAMQDVFGSSPLATMYWNSALSIPAANNPWLNQNPTHPYNVGSQFNHSSAATIALRNRVYAHWLNDYHLDGFRFDLAGGYTQTNYGTGAGSAWESTYDQGRINTWDSINTQLQTISPGSYCILESFVGNAELQNYVNQGMMVWGGGANMNGSSTQASMGYNSNSDLSSGLYSANGFTQPGLVDYQESHDETVGGDERVMFKNENYGNSSGSYNIQDTATGLQRAAMTAALWAMLPGPKMMWMFGELGYDYSPNACSNGALTCNNIDPKPLPWAKYYLNTNRQALYTVYSKLFNLRNVPANITTFTNNGKPANTQYSLSGTIKWISDTGDSLQVMAYGNFGVSAQTGTVTFPGTGTWTNLFTGSTINITTTTQNVTLNPGEYYVYTYSVKGVVTAVDNVTANNMNALQLIINPNPVQSIATVQYVIPESGNVNLAILDMTGRKIADVFSGFKTKGIQSVTINTGQLFSTQTGNGMYLLQLEINGQRKTEKFILIK